MCHCTTTAAGLEQLGRPRHSSPTVHPRVTWMPRDLLALHRYIKKNTLRRPGLRQLTEPFSPSVTQCTFTNNDPTFMTVCYSPPNKVSLLGPSSCTLRNNGDVERRGCCRRYHRRATVVRSGGVTALESVIPSPGVCCQHNK